MSKTFGETRLGRAANGAFGGACLLVLLSVIAWVLHLGAQRPVHNFDLVDYVAMALEWGEPNRELVHQQAYATLAAELPPEVYANFVSGSEFRADIHRDWKLFDANLGFHRGRYLFSLAVLAAHKTGIPLTEATWVVNQLFWAATAILVLAWARRHFALGPASLLTLGVLYAPPVLSLVPASSPESMAMFFVSLGLYLLLEKQAHGAAATALTLTILVRPEFVLVCLSVAAGLFFFVDRLQRPSTRFLVLWSGLCVALWVTISITARDPGWWAVFVSPFLRVGELTKVPDFEPRYYAWVLRKKLEPLHYLGYDVAPDGSFVRGSSFLFTYMCAAAVGIVLAVRTRMVELQPYTAVFAGLIVATLARLVLFPFPWDRYFVYLWVPVPLCLAGLAALLIARLSPRV